MAHVHVANSLNQPIYVLPSKKVGWRVVDIVADVALLLVGIGELRAAMAATNLPATINTVRDLVQFLKLAGTLVSGTLSVSGRSADAAKELIEAFKKNSIRIDPRNVKDIFDTTGLDWLNVSAIAAGLFDADTVNLTVMTADGRQTTNFDTNHDHSWIVEKNEIVRAQYGRLWVSDRQAGYYRFSVSDRLMANQYLEPNQCISSPNGVYDFVYQADGNAVVYRRNQASGEVPVWASKTNGKKAWRVYMQGDGNFVTYEKQGSPVWSSNEYGSGDKYKNCRLIMQDDGNLVVYNEAGKALWDIQHRG